MAPVQKPFSFGSQPLLGFNSYLLANTLSSSAIPAPRIGTPPAYSSSGGGGSGGSGRGGSINSSGSGGGVGSGGRGAYYPPVRYESPSLLGTVIFLTIHLQQHVPTLPLPPTSNTSTNTLKHLLSRS